MKKLLLFSLIFSSITIFSMKENHIINIINCSDNSVSGFNSIGELPSGIQEVLVQENKKREQEKNIKKIYELSMYSHPLIIKHFDSIEQLPNDSINEIYKISMYSHPLIIKNF